MSEEVARPQSRTKLCDDRIECVVHCFPNVFRCVFQKCVKTSDIPCGDELLLFFAQTRSNFAEPQAGFLCLISESWAGKTRKIIRARAVRLYFGGVLYCIKMCDECIGCAFCCVTSGCVEKGLKSKRVDNQGKTTCHQMAVLYCMLNASVL